MIDVPQPIIEVDITTVVLAVSLIARQFPHRPLVPLATIACQIAYKSLSIAAWLDSAPDESWPLHCDNGSCQL